MLQVVLLFVWVFGRRGGGVGVGGAGGSGEGEGVGEASSFPSTVPYLRRQVPYLALYLTFF